MAVDSFHVESFKNGTTIKFGFLLEHHFNIGIDIKGNLEMVLPTMEPQERILSRHVYNNCFVCAIFIVLVPGCLAVKSL